MEKILICTAQFPACDHTRQSAVGKFLALEALAQLTGKSVGQLVASGVSLAHRENGQPYFTGSGFFVSITHTKTAAAAAVAPFPVGIDLESTSRKSIKAAKKIFSEKQFRWFLAHDTENNSLFAQLWTLHEAYAKWTGLGLARMPSVEFYPDNSIICSDPNCQAANYTVLEGFSLSLCLPSKREFTAEIKKIAFS